MKYKCLLPISPLRAKPFLTSVWGGFGPQRVYGEGWGRQRLKMLKMPPLLLLYSMRWFDAPAARMASRSALVALRKFLHTLMCYFVNLHRCLICPKTVCGEEGGSGQRVQCACSHLLTSRVTAKSTATMAGGNNASMARSVFGWILAKQGMFFRFLLILLKFRRFWSEKRPLQAVRG